jgi:hypothetical protein
LEQPATCAFPAVGESYRLPDQLNFASEGESNTTSAMGIASPQHNNAGNHTPSTVVPPDDEEDRTRQAIAEQFATPVPTAPQPIERSMSMPIAECTRAQSPTSAGFLETSVETQPDQVPKMKKTLGYMMQPEHLTQGDTQTQLLPVPPQTTQPLRPVNPSAALEMLEVFS